MPYGTSYYGKLSYADSDSECRNIWIRVARTVLTWGKTARTTLTWGKVSKTVLSWTRSPKP